MSYKNRSAPSSETEDESHPHRRAWRGSVQPSVTVVKAVAAATGRNPKALPPLYSVVDTDGLDALVSGARNTDETIRVTFDYAGTTVVVDTGDGVCVWPNDAERE